MKTENKIGLKISFDYLSGNDILLDLVKKIADKHRIKGYLLKDKDRVEIIVSASIDDMQKFSKELGEKLPYSIFMGEASTQVIEELPDFIPEKFEIKKDINILPQNLSICPSCLNELFDVNNRRFYFPFISCNYCGSHHSFLYEYPFEREKTVFRFFKMCRECEKEFKDSKSFRYKYPLTACPKCLTPMYFKEGKKEAYLTGSDEMYQAIKKITDLIKEGNLIQIYTTNGDKIVGSVSKENISKIRNIYGRKPLTVMFTGIDHVNKYAVASQNELKALASQEKPTLYLKPTDLFKDFYDTGFFLGKLPDDPVFLMLCENLKKEGIEHLIIEDLKENITDIELNADIPVINPQKDMKIMVVEDLFLIEDGEKGIIPNIVKSKLTGNLSIFGDYAALDLGEGEYLIDRKEKIINQIDGFVDSVESFNYGIKREDINIPYNRKKEYKDYQGAILSVLAEHNIIDKPAVGIYLSHRSDNNLIAVKSHTKPLTPLIRIKPVRIYNDFSKTVSFILNSIKNSSQEGDKLIKNLCKNFPEICERFPVENPEGDYRSSSNLTAVLNAISILTGLFPHNDIHFYEEPFLYLQKKAVEYRDKKGLKVDCVLIEKDGEFFLDWIKLVQSVLSYKVAEAEKEMIAFSVFEGISDWIINETSTVLSKLKIENVALAGDLLMSPLLSGKLINYFSKNHKLYINRKLPVDRVNVAFGGIFI